MGLFERYLSLWVALCIAAGVLLGNLFPPIFAAVAGLECAHVNLPVLLSLVAFVNRNTTGLGPMIRLLSYRAKVFLKPFVCIVVKENLAGFP